MAGRDRRGPVGDLGRFRHGRVVGGRLGLGWLPPDRYPVLTSVAPDMTGADAEDRFEFGLTVLIAGLEAASAAEREAAGVTAR